MLAHGSGGLPPPPSPPPGSTGIPNAGSGPDTTSSAAHTRANPAAANRRPKRPPTCLLNETTPTGDRRSPATTATIRGAGAGRIGMPPHIREPPSTTAPVHYVDAG